MTKAWVSTDGVPHFGEWHEGIICSCEKSTHELLKQYDSMLDPEIDEYLKPPDLGINISDTAGAEDIFGEPPSNLRPPNPNPKHVMPTDEDVHRVLDADSENKN